MDTADVLTELALDLRWSFNHSTDKLWERLDPELWDLTHTGAVAIWYSAPASVGAALARISHNK